MPAGAVVLILLAAVAHAAWNIAAKRASGAGTAFVWLNSVISAVLYAPLGLFVLATSDTPLITVLRTVALASVLHGTYFLVLQHGYSVGDISVVYPLARGTGPLLSVILAVALLGERPGVGGLAGAGLVVAGVIVIGLSGRVPANGNGSGGGSGSGPGGGPGAATLGDLGTGQGSGHGSRHDGSALLGVAYGLVTGVIIASYTLWDAHAVTTLAVAPILLSWGTNVGEALFLAPLVIRRRAKVAEVWRAHRREVLIVGVGSPLAYILVLFAMRLAPVALVAPGRELSVVLVSLAGWLMFREPAPYPRLVGAAIVLGGVALLSLTR